MVFSHDYVAFPELTNSQLEVLQFSSPHVQIVEDFFATVVRVHDGDTVTLRTEFRDFDFPLRVAGVDAPELSEGGDEARAWLEARLTGEEVMVIIDPDNRVGKYGRLIGEVMHRGMLVSDEMFYLGLVSEFGSKNEGSVVPIDKVLREGDISA